MVGIYGGQGQSIGKQISQLEDGADIVVATPGRLVDMIGRKVVDFKNLKVTCLDEADEMLNMGFQKDI